MSFHSLKQSALEALDSAIRNAENELEKLKSARQVLYGEPYEPPLQIFPPISTYDDSLSIDPKFVNFDAMSVDEIIAMCDRHDDGRYVVKSEAGKYLLSLNVISYDGRLLPTGYWLPIQAGEDDYGSFGSL